MIASFGLGFLAGFGTATVIVVGYLVYSYFREDGEIQQWNERERIRKL